VTTAASRSAPSPGYWLASDTCPGPRSAGTIREYWSGVTIAIWPSASHLTTYGGAPFGPTTRTIRPVRVWLLDTRSVSPACARITAPFLVLLESSLRPPSMILCFKPDRIDHCGAPGLAAADRIHHVGSRSPSTRKNVPLSSASSRRHSNRGSAKPGLPRRPASGMATAVRQPADPAGSAWLRQATLYACPERD
jgi:hypothetical protein